MIWSNLHPDQWSGTGPLKKKCLTLKFDMWSFFLFAAICLQRGEAHRLLHVLLIRAIMRRKFVNCIKMAKQDLL